MAEIPTALPAAAAQATIRSREVAKSVEAVRTADGSAARRNAQAVDEAGVIVDTTDADARVFTDAEGQGGQGRSDAEADEATESNRQADKGITLSENGSWHVDIEA